LNSKFGRIKSIMENIDFSRFTNLSEVVEYQIDMEKLESLEKKYVDHDVISLTPEFHYLEDKYGKV